MLKEDLTGVWKLKNFEIERQGGLVEQWRKDMRGQLIYTEDGFMSVSINGRPREGYESSDGGLFYSGKYQMKDESLVAHEVLNASDPNRIGKQMLREIHLDGNDLHIVGRGDFGVARLIWTRDEI